MASDIGDWLDMMPDTVIFYARTGRDDQGKPVFSSTPSSPIPCRVQMENHLIVDGKGREILARGKIILGSTFAPDIEDKIVLPAGYTPASPPMLAVNPEPDESGPHHTTIEIG